MSEPYEPWKTDEDRILETISYIGLHVSAEKLTRKYDRKILRELERNKQPWENKAKWNRMGNRKRPS